MNRIVRAIVSSASAAFALVAVPAVASAHPIPVAPPAYPPAFVQPSREPVYVPPPAPVTRPVAAWSRDHERREEWARDHERREELRRRHERECARAYEDGASPWVLAAMRCPPY